MPLLVCIFLNWIRSEGFIPRWPWRCWRTATIVSSPVLRCLERWTVTCAKPWLWRARRPILPWWAVPIRVCRWKRFSMPCPVISLCWGMPATLVSGLGSFQVSLFDFSVSTSPEFGLPWYSVFMCFYGLRRLRFWPTMSDENEALMLKARLWGAWNSAPGLWTLGWSLCWATPTAELSRELLRPIFRKRSEPTTPWTSCWTSWAPWCLRPKVSAAGTPPQMRSPARPCGAQQLESEEPNRLKYLELFCILLDYLLILVERVFQPFSSSQKIWWIGAGSEAERLPHHEFHAEALRCHPREGAQWSAGDPGRRLWLEHGEGARVQAICFGFLREHLRQLYS